MLALLKRSMTSAATRSAASSLRPQIGTSSIRTSEEIATLRGELAARAEAVIVARDESGRPRALTSAERAALGPE